MSRQQGIHDAIQQSFVDEFAEKQRATAEVAATFAHKRSVLVAECGEVGHIFGSGTGSCVVCGAFKVE